MDWKKANGDAVDLVLSGPAGDDSGRPFKVKLSKNQYATLQLADILIEAGKPDKLWGCCKPFGQASPFASATVGLTLPKVRPLPGPVVVVEAGPGRLAHGGLVRRRRRRREGPFSVHPAGGEQGRRYCDRTPTQDTR